MWWLSGITRDVFLTLRPRTHIRDYSVRTRVTPVSLNARPAHVVGMGASVAEDPIEAEVDIDVELQQLAHTASKLPDADDELLKPTCAMDDVPTWKSDGQPLLVEAELLDGATVVCRSTLVVEMRRVNKRTAGYVRGTMRVPPGSARRWSAETPALYTLVLTLRHGVDVIEVLSSRVGLRTVEVRGGRLLVNGVPITLAGVNRHEHDPMNGHVLSREGMAHDLRLMKDLNFNCVRTSHYPCDEAWCALWRGGGRWQSARHERHRRDAVHTHNIRACTLAGMRYATSWACM